MATTDTSIFDGFESTVDWDELLRISDEEEAKEEAEKKAAEREKIERLKEILEARGILHGQADRLENDHWKCQFYTFDNIDDVCDFFQNETDTSCRHKILSETELEVAKCFEKDDVESAKKYADVKEQLNKQYEEYLKECERQKEKRQEEYAEYLARTV